MLPILTGLAAGAMHVLTGPDHLAAVAPLAADAPWSPWKLGVRWAVGHSSGVALVGALLIALRGSFNPEPFSNWAEAGVGLGLVGVGLWTFRRAFSQKLHAHQHSHDGEKHLHFHVHSDSTAHAPGSAAGHHHSHAALGLGALHGLAGSSHFFAVLPALAMPRLMDSALYLACYAGGTVFAMAGFAQLVGKLAAGAARSGALAYRRSLAAAAALTFCIGLWWIAASLAAKPWAS